MSIEDMIIKSCFGSRITKHNIQMGGKNSDDITLLSIYRSVAGQPWHQGDLCTKGWRGLGEQRNEETERHEGGARRNDMRKSEEETRRGVEMRKRDEEELRLEGGRRSSNVSCHQTSSSATKS